MQHTPLLLNPHCFGRYQPAASWTWALIDLCALGAHAAEFSVTAVPLTAPLPSVVMAPLRARVTSCDLGDYAGLSGSELQALLLCPRLRRVRCGDLNLTQDASQQACQWEELTINAFNGVTDLLRLPVGIRRLLVMLDFTCRGDEEEEVAAALRRWEPGTVVMKPMVPPPSAEFWRLSELEQQCSFFSLNLFHETCVAGHQQLLEQVVFPPGRGPHTLELRFQLGTVVAPSLQLLAPMLQRSRVRTLCAWLDWGYSAVQGMLSVLPATVACVRLRTKRMADAAAAIHGLHVAQALRVVVLLPRAPSALAGVVEAQQLNLLRAALQPIVTLELQRLEE